MKNRKYIKSLQSLCANYKADIVDGPFGSNLKRCDYRTEGIPVLKIQNIKRFQIELKKMDYVNSDKYNELKRHSYSNGDIVMTKLGNPLGASAIVNEMDDGLIVADLVRIRANKINTKYLCYHLNSPVTANFINSQQKGTTRPRVRIANVRELPIYSPPLPEQKRIVAILDKAFTAIDKAKANAEKNLANAKELFESYLNGIFENPGEDWEEKKLGNLGTLTSSKRIFKKEYVTSGVPFYRSKEIKELAHDKEISLELFITNEKYNEIKSKFGIPQAGDILLTAVGTIGEMYVVKNNDTFYFKDGNIMWLKGFKTLDTFYLKYALTSFVKQLQSMSQGSAYNALTIEKLKKYSVPVPSLKEQKKIVQNFDVLSAETKKLETVYQHRINNLDELKKSILKKAFEGEL